MNEIFTLVYFNMLQRSISIIKKRLTSLTIKFFSPMLLLLIFNNNLSRAQWQKIDGAGSWKVNSIVVKDSKIFAGTDGNGIFISSDNGESWAAIKSEISDSVIYALATNGTSTFAGTENGIFISEDNGINWTADTMGLNNNGVWSLSINPNSTEGSEIFAGTWNGVYHSTNSGMSWNITSLSNTSMPVSSIFITNLYVLAGTQGGGFFNLSSDGTEYNIITLYSYRVEHQIYPLTIPVYSILANKSYIIVGSADGVTFRSSGDIVSWKKNYVGGFYPVRSLIAIDSIVIAGTLGDGVYRSNTDALIWVSMGLKNTIVISLAASDSYIFAGTNSGIWRIPLSDIITGIIIEKELPDEFKLQQNYPNPFNPTTKIGYELRKGSKISLEVFDILGRYVATLAEGYQEAGNYIVTFDAPNLSSGVYIYQLKTDNQILTKKMILGK
jgi:Secretion system C-terminal sorting domain